VHLSKIDVNLLVVFDTVYAEGGITPASRKLNLSQPAVSHALARLREVLGDPLFERRGRGVAATPLARSIAGPIREALRTLQRTLGEAGSFEPGSSPRDFKIGMSPALETSVLAPLTSSLRSSSPLSRIVSLRLERRRMEQELSAGEVDLALDVLLPLAERVPHERVLLDRLVVVARKDHPAFKRLRRGQWSLETYLAQQHIQVSSRRQGPGIEDMALRPLGRSRNVRLRCQSHAAACRVAAQTDLVATIPAAYAGTLIIGDSARLLPLPLAGLQIETYMYWADNADRDAANQWLRRQVRAALAANKTGSVTDP
jgi:DNA-binding transcriptional LysR family regulator